MRTTLVLALLLLFFPSAAISAADDQRFDVPLNNAPQRGPQDAPVTIIEFLDFQ
jgi:hypothetical protein